MSAKIRIPTTLRPATGGVAEVEVEAGTLAGVLDGLEAKHPGFKSRIFDDEGGLRDVDERWMEPSTISN